VVRFQDQDIQTPESLANGVRRRTKIRSDGGGKVVGLETKNKRLSRVMRNGDWNDIYRADHSRHAGIQSTPIELWRSKGAEGTSRSEYGYLEAGGKLHCPASVVGVLVREHDAQQ
jgi:hypothetical protein